jgi:hypothetical protein
MCESRGGVEAENILVIKKTWNFIDFQLLRIGEIISLGNVSKGEVKDKENDLGAAFFLLGTILSAQSSFPV